MRMGEEWYVNESLKHIKLSGHSRLLDATHGFFSLFFGFSKMKEKYVHVIWLFFSIKPLYLIGLWFSEDLKKNMT